MKARVLALAFLSLILVGCPAGGFFGRYLLVNNTESTVRDLTISGGVGSEQIWQETLPGQGWIHSKPFLSKYVDVTWSDDTGLHQEEIRFEKKVSYRSKADLYIELKPHGQLAWRIIDPPADDGAPSTALMVVAGYGLYLLGIIMLVGVPLALVALSAYGFFKVGRLICREVAAGLHGDQSVFQFTIREVLMLTTMVALALGWFFTTKH